MFCQECGTPIGFDGRYCPKCGSTATTSQPTLRPGPDQTSTNSLRPIPPENRLRRSAPTKPPGPSTLSLKTPTRPSSYLPPMSGAATSSQKSVYPNNNYSIIAIVFGTVALFIAPLIFGILGIVFAGLALQRNERHGLTAMIVVVSEMIIGFVTAIIFQLWLLGIFFALTDR